MKTKLGWVAATILVAASPLAAHHAFSAEFDVEKAISLKGVVTKVEWTNPHIWLYFDVMKETSGVTHWQCEGGAPNALVQQGWTRDSLKPADAVSVEGSGAKDGSNTCHMNWVNTADGKKLFAYPGYR